MVKQATLCFRLSFHAAVNCSDAPARPANGQRSGSGTTFGSIVTYTCNHGYSLSTLGRNKITLTCMANGNWNGSAPQCNGKSLCNAITLLLKRHIVEEESECGYNFIKCFSV